MLNFYYLTYLEGSPSATSRLAARCHLLNRVMGVRVPNAPGLGPSILIG